MEELVLSEESSGDLALGTAGLLEAAVSRERGREEGRERCS